MSAETFYEAPRVLDTLVSFEEDASTNQLLIRREQELPDWWLSEVRKAKVDTKNDRIGDGFYPVASIPVEVVDELERRYNFDVFKAPVAETLKMLDRLALDAFILTTKQF